MPIAAEAPDGGIVEQFGSESHVLILRNGEIERFEKHHDTGIFAVLDQVVGLGDLKVTHCRDIVALGLVGGGLADKSADKILADMPPHENHRLRSIAQALLLAAFVRPDDIKKKATDEDGSSVKTGPKATKRKTKSKAQSARV